MDRNTAAKQKNIILIINLGTPDQPTYQATWRYLRAFLSDPRVIEIPKAIWYPILYGYILPFRSYSSSQKYLEVYDQEHGLPLLHYSKQLCAGINQQMQQHYDNVECILSMRYGSPNLAKTLEGLNKECIRNLCILPLFPQYSATTTATIMDVVGKELKKWRYVPNIEFINGFWDHPDYIRTIVDNIKQHWSKHTRAQKLLLSYHGLPKRNLTKGDPYYCLCQKSTRLIAEQLKLSNEEYDIVFQSRFGPSEWLQPYTEDKLIEYAKAGIKTVDVIAPGFIADCLETDDEIAREYAELFKENGGQELRYIPAMNASKNSVTFFYKLLQSRCHFLQNTMQV